MTSRQPKPPIGPLVAPRIGRQRQPWQRGDAHDPVTDPPSRAEDEIEDEDEERDEDGSGHVLSLLVVVVVLLVTLPATFWVLDYGRLDPFSSASAAPPAAVPPPAALAGPGAYIDARVQPDGSIRVTQWVRPPTELRSAALLVQPRSGSDVVATGVRLRVDGRAVAGPSTVRGDLTAYRWRTPGRVLRLTYTLGAAARRSPLGSTFLAVRYPDPTGPTVVRVSGPGVRGLTCAGVVDDRDPVPCGRRVSGSAWQVRLSEADFTHRVLVTARSP